MAFYPFGPIVPAGTPMGPPRPFSQSEWDKATEEVQNLYANNGYIYAQVRARGGPADRQRRQAGDRSALDHPGGISGHDQQDGDRRQRRDPRAGHPRSDRDAAGRPLQPRPTHPLVSERLQPRLLPAAVAVARREAGRQRRRRGHRVPGRGEANRQHQLRRVAGAGHRGRRLPGTGGAEPLRPRQARPPPVAVREEHQRFHAELHRPEHQREPDLRDDLALRLPGPVHHRRSRTPEADRWLHPVRLPVPRLPLHPHLHLVLVPADPLQRGVGGSSGSLQLQLPAPAPRSGSAFSGTPGSACRSPRAAR